MVTNKILESVKGFLVKLIKDEDFRTQLMSDKVEDIKKFMADGGYKFSQDEFTTAAIKILELKELGEFEDLTEEELVGAVGGVAKWQYWRHHKPVLVKLPPSIKFDPTKLPPGIDVSPIDHPGVITHYGGTVPREESVKAELFISTSEQSQS
jgi:predicted ribosomally synthesized peptide with nif11-like leader